MGNLKKVPEIRFPEFKKDWGSKKFGDLTERISIPVAVEKSNMYQQIGIRSHGKGIFHKELVDGKSLGNKRVFWVQENCLVVNIVFAWEQAVAKTTANEKGMIASHRFPMYAAKENKSDVDYLLHFFLTTKGKKLLELASPGGAGRNKTLGQKEFEKLNFLIPEQKEQQKIAQFLSTLNSKITQLNDKLNLLEQYKKGVMQKLFSQELRFKDENGKVFPNWQKKKLGECLEYEQPTNYLVSDTEYDEKYDIPVVTAGKTFILGYTNEKEGVFRENLPVIIFDDFTTASQFVDFPFKTKSSAMKILKPKGNIDVKFMFEALQMIKYETGGHGRHWISIFSQMDILLPSPKEQAKIASFLSKIDAKIDQIKIQIEQNQEWKKGLLQKMFC